MPSQTVAMFKAPSPQTIATSVADSSISLASFITADIVSLARTLLTAGGRHKVGHHVVTCDLNADSSITLVSLT